MSDVQPPVFSDQGKTASQESPSMTQGESPRATQPTDPDRAEFEAWKQNQKEAKEVSSPKADKVDSGRGPVPTEAVKSEQVRDAEVEPEISQSYVWLPDGQIRLVNDEDLPGSMGTNAQYGLWEEDGKVYHIVAVYPKEFTKKESN